MKAELTLPERPATVHLLAVLDILVLLLVFFVLLTSVSQEAGIAARTPESSFRLKSYGKRVVVTVRGGPMTTVYVGSKRVDLEDLESVLVERAEQDGVETMFLNADEMLPYGVARQIQEVGLRVGLNVVLVGRQGGGEPHATEAPEGQTPSRVPGPDETRQP